jgi:hypothetical protein
MVRAALAKDLQYLHESLQRQRVMSPLADEEDPYDAALPKGKSAYFQRLREPARLRSFEEHVEAISGLPLDSVQLLFRSELPENEIEDMHEVAAAIVKTEHDLHFWEPLELLGISKSFRLHQKALQDDLVFIQANRPPADRVALLAAWAKTSDRLKKTLLAVD